MSLAKIFNFLYPKKKKEAAVSKSTRPELLGPVIPAAKKTQNRPYSNESVRTSDYDDSSDLTNAVLLAAALSVNNDVSNYSQNTNDWASGCGGESGGAGASGSWSDSSSSSDSYSSSSYDSGSSSDSCSYDSGSSSCDSGSW